MVVLNVVVIEVGNVAVVMSTCHHESESGCLTREKYLSDSEMYCMSGAAGDAVDGKSDQSGGSTLGLVVMVFVEVLASGCWLS